MTDASPVLLVTTVPLDRDALESLVVSAELGDADVRVLSPSVNESAIAYWVSDPDEAIQEAEHAARATASALRAAPDPNVVAADVGDSDPLTAIEDALAQSPAARIVVARRTGDDARYREDRLAPAALERRFGLPVAEVAIG